MRAVAVVLAFCLLGAAHAQSLPSVDQMVDSLDTKTVAKKCPPGVAKCRGIAAATATDEDVAPGEAAPAQHAARHHAAQAPSSGSGLLDLTIEFTSGSATLTPSAEQALGRLGLALSNERLAAYRFRIEGHTDTVGVADQNQALSEKRAASVAAYLESSFGIATARLEPVGMGEQGLAVPTPDQTAEARNRRVHIVNLGS